MLFAGFVVAQDALLQRVLNQIVGDFRAYFFVVASASQRGGHFQHVVGAARIAAGIGRNFCQDFVGRLQLHRAQTAFLVSQCALAGARQSALRSAA